MFEIPKINQIVKINVFDDGRREFEQYINQWKITKVMFEGGKIVGDRASSFLACVFLYAFMKIRAKITKMKNIFPF